MKITFINGGEAGKSFEFSLPEITVGREDANILRIPTEGVSRYHARFKQDLKGSWTVCDQGSTNGVKVNGERISGDYYLAENDRVMIGEQLLMVSDLSGEPPKIVFNPVITDTPGTVSGAAPGTANSVNFEIPVKSEQPDMDDEVLKKTFSGNGLFARRNDDAGDEKISAVRQNGGKRRMSPMLFYTIIICVSIVAITSCIKMFSPGSAGRAASGSVPTDDSPISLYFEKLSIQRDNVFRFSLSLENRKAVFCIDDIGSRRHPEPLVVKDPPGLDVLRGRLESSGIWSVSKPAPASDNSGIRRRLSVMIGSRVVGMVIDGHRSPAEFEEVESAIYEFAEGCGMQTVSMSSEEIMRLAKENFGKAEDLFANRESDGANLRDAISRYRVVVNYLSQFSPPLKMWKVARERLAEAEKIRKAKLADLEYERVRLQNVRDFESLRRVFMETMVLTEPESTEYNLARKRLHILDVRLKQRRGAR